MFDAASNSSSSSWIRILLLLAILVVPQILRLLQKSRTKAAPPLPEGRKVSLAELLKTMQESAREARGQRASEPSADEAADGFGQSMRGPSVVPPSSQPESSLLPSLLLLALLGCLAAMAVLHWMR